MICMCVAHTVVSDSSHQSGVVFLVASTKWMMNSMATFNTTAAARAAQKVLGTSLVLSTTTTTTITITTNLFMYLAHTCAGDAHRLEAYPSRPKTLTHLNSQLAPSAALLLDKDANDTD